MGMILHKTRRRWGRVTWVLVTNGTWFLFLAPTARTPLQFLRLWSTAAVVDSLPWALALIPLSGIVLEFLRLRFAAYVNGGYWIVLSGALLYGMVASQRGIHSHSGNLDLYAGLELFKLLLPFAILISVVDVILYSERWWKAEEEVASNR